METTQKVMASSAGQRLRELFRRLTKRQVHRASKGLALKNNTSVRKDAEHQSALRQKRPTRDCHFKLTREQLSNAWTLSMAKHCRQNCGNITNIEVRCLTHLPMPLGLLAR